ncbi:MAG: glycosyltransferase [Candidatus Eisenbacteria bacterium]|nr:glycosyltransferase [Candidatus Eisenbacteria bacterium]
MKVLVLDEWIPYPLISGKRLRSYHLLARAARNHKITYLCFADPSGEEGARKQIESLGIRLLTLPKRNPFVPAYRLYSLALANMFASTPLVMKKHFRRDYLVTLNQLVKEEDFDLIHCEWTHYGAYVTGLQDRPLFLSSHNIEAMPWQRLYQHEKNPIKRALLHLEWRKMLRFEEKVCRRFDHVGAVSEDDRYKFKTSYGCESVTVIPNGIDVHYYDSVKPDLASKSLVFSASFDAFVNQDAVAYFMESIFPRVLEKDPGVTTTFLGKDPPPFLRRLAGERAVFTGTVEDVRPHLSRSTLCIVPVRIAGGSRIKILEAMAAGLPVVSTPEGAEGLEVVPGEHILIARSEEEFAGYVIRLLNDKSLAQSLSAKARKLVEERYDWDKIAPLLEQAWRETVVRFQQRDKDPQNVGSR